MEKNTYVIGIDGGGTKTLAALANLKGKILKIGKGPSSHPRNLGLKRAIENLAKVIEKVLPKKGKILSTFVGLPAVAEEYKSKVGKIKKELKKHKVISKIFEGKLIINSDQKVAFRAGIDGNGVMLNCGTGCVAHGWKNKKEAHASGWGWLGDEGGAFFIGQKVFQAVLKDLDGRGAKTLLTKIVFKKLKLKSEEDFLNFVYQKNPTEILPKFSIFCDEASKKGDRIAKRIMIEAAKEAALAAKAVIKKLNFEKEKFPIVLVGGMFKSKIFREKVKREIKKVTKRAKFILLRKKPVVGAVKLAINSSLYKNQKIC
jgi:N-acetylglucosamine kinase-like BadF-type ATPase